MATRRTSSPSTAAFRFFYENAGYSYDSKRETKEQGRRRSALALARAESEAARRGWTVAWGEDPEADLSWADADEREEISEVLNAVLHDRKGDVLASLGGITFGYNSIQNRKQGRVIEAELALEALATSRRSRRRE